MTRIAYCAIFLSVTMLIADDIVAAGQFGLDLAGAPATPFSFSLSPDRVRIPVGGTVSATLHVSVPDGYYLYADRMNIEVVSPRGIRLRNVKWPEPVQKHDPHFDKFLPTYPEPLEVSLELEAAGEVAGDTLLLRVEYMGCSPTLCYPPQAAEVQSELELAPPVTPAPLPVRDEPAQAPRSETTGWFDVGLVLERRGLVALLLILFLSGVALDFVACIYPMIPVTIAAIGAKENRSPFIGFTLSLAYVAGIVLTFAVLGVIVSLAGRAMGLTFVNPWVAGVLAAILIAMGLSMLGLYEIRPPNSLLQKAQLKRRGYLGAFMLGLVGGIIATPCGTPVLVGLAGFAATTRQPALGALLFGSFGFGIGSLFLVIGTSWGALNLLPKAGQWMENVKKVFGVLMFAVALWVLSPVVPREYLRWAWTFGALALGILVGGLAALPPGAGPAAQLRKGVGLTFFAVGLAMLLIQLGIFSWHGEQSGQLMSPRDADTTSGVLWQNLGTDVPSVVETPGEPALVYFTADWCPACHELKAKTFSDRAVTALARRFRTILFDGTHQTSPAVKEVERRYDVVAYPTILFFDRQGQLMRDMTVIGFVGPAEFAAHLERVLEAVGDGSP